jgi:hypothetical protein
VHDSEQGIFYHLAAGFNRSFGSREFLLALPGDCGTLLAL